MRRKSTRRWVKIIGIREIRLVILPWPFSGDRVDGDRHRPISIARGQPVGAVRPVGRDQRRPAAGGRQQHAKPRTPGEWPIPWASRTPCAAAVDGTAWIAVSPIEPPLHLLERHAFRLRYARRHPEQLHQHHHREEEKHLAGSE